MATKPLSSQTTNTQTDVPTDALPAGVRAVIGINDPMIQRYVKHAKALARIKAKYNVTR